MAGIVSRHVNITDRQEDAVKAYAEGKQISFSEALRRIVDGWMDGFAYSNVTVAVESDPDPFPNT